MAYASTTNVSVEKSKAQIETLLMKNGATAFAAFTNADEAAIQFTINDRMIRFSIIIPKQEDNRRGGRHNYLLSDSAAETKWKQAIRSRWRGLLLCIKAKLESVESEISTFEEEFMAHTVLPDGRTVAEFMEPQLKLAYESGEAPKMLGFSP